jgi:hypothetical protein
VGFQWDSKVLIPIHISPSGGALVLVSECGSRELSERFKIGCELIFDLYRANGRSPLGPVWRCSGIDSRTAKKRKEGKLLQGCCRNPKENFYLYSAIRVPSDRQKIK